MKTPLPVLTTVLVALLISCTNDSNTRYRLQTSVSPTASGTVAPASGDFEDGESVELTATPNQHWVFKSWDGDHTGSMSPSSVMMDRDRNVTAIFEKRSYPLVIETEGDGTVTETILQQKSTHYDAGARVELSAVPADGWRFSHWQEDLDGNQNPVVIEVTAPKSITAVFIPKEYALTVNVTGEGTVTENIVQQKSTDYPYQTIVELAADAAEGWSFTRWEGDISGTENPARVSIDTEKTVTAVFEKNSYSLVINVSGNGTVTEQVVHAKEYTYRTTVELTGLPAEGWEFSHWEGDLSGNENPAQVIVTNGMEITAVFVKGYFPITITLEGAGMTTFTLVTGNQSEDRFEYESVVDVSVQGITDWQFVSWEGDLTGTDNPVRVVVNGPVTATARMRLTTFDGEGTPDIPYQIRTLEQLQKISGFLDKHFIQVADIDASETEGWNQGSGFVPIGLFDFQKFSGSYNGNGYRIDGLFIDLDGYVYGDPAVGLFGYLSGAHIRNVTLTNARITGSLLVGGLAGYALNNTLIEHVAVNGVVTGIRYVGGVAGALTGSTVSFATADVRVTGNADIGGTIGSANESRINGAGAEGTVSGESTVGGLIGSQHNAKMLSNSHAAASVTGTRFVGGLIGGSFNTLEAVARSYATGAVNGTENVGGLIGFFSGFSSIGESYAVGKVQANPGSNAVGGLVGSLALNGRIVKSFAHGDVTGGTAVGGLLGRNTGIVQESYASGSVTGISATGGLVGDNQGGINSSYWDLQTSTQEYGHGGTFSGEVTGLTTSQMSGSDAVTNMSDFDWVFTWKTTPGYPALKGITTGMLAK